MIVSQTIISDALHLLQATYTEPIRVYDPEVYNPLCLCGAAAAEGMTEELLTNYTPEFFSNDEATLIMDVHELCGEILNQYDRMKEIEE